MQKILKQYLFNRKYSAMEEKAIYLSKKKPDQSQVKSNIFIEYKIELSLSNYFF